MPPLFRSKLHTFHSISKMCQFEGAKTKKLNLKTIIAAKAKLRYFDVVSGVRLIKRRPSEKNDKQQHETMRRNNCFRTPLTTIVIQMSEINTCTENSEISPKKKTEWNTWMNEWMNKTTNPISVIAQRKRISYKHAAQTQIIYMKEEKNRIEIENCARPWQIVECHSTLISMIVVTRMSIHCTEYVIKSENETLSAWVIFVPSKIDHFVHRHSMESINRCGAKNRPWIVVVLFDMFTDTCVRRCAPIHYLVEL